jgi:hypothetical protein
MLIRIGQQTPFQAAQQHTRMCVAPYFHETPMASPQRIVPGRAHVPVMALAAVLLATALAQTT